MEKADAYSEPCQISLTEVFREDSSLLKAVAFSS